MNKRLRRFQKTLLCSATLTLLWLPRPTLAQTQSATTQDRQQDRQSVQSDDITRRDLARFDQFLDSHREIAGQLRKTPSLIEDPQFLQNHPDLNAYLQDHPSVRQEISQRPDTFMRLEDQYDRDSNMRDRDARGQDRDANRSDAANDRNAGQDRDVNRGDAANDRNPGQDRDVNRGDAANDRNAGQDRDANRRDDDRGGQARDERRIDIANFDRFLDSHREIAEQVRRNPSLVDNREFVENHPALQSYLQDNPGVRDLLRRDPNALMQREDANDRDPNMRPRDANGQDRDANRGNVANDRDAGRQDRDANRRDADDRDQGQDRDNHRGEMVNFDRFLDSHREISEQVRRNPSLVDNRNFMQNHPALQAYLQENPGVRDELRRDPNAFMQQGFNDRENMRDRDPMHEHMADFGGFLGGHSEIQRDLSRDPNVVKNHDYVQNHTELNTYLNAHPDVRADLLANPQGFVQGAQQYNSGSTGMTGRGTGTTGSSTGTTTTRPPTTQKPNQ